MEKEIVTVAAALTRVNNPSAAKAGEKPVPPKARWRFVKNFGPADVIRFRDGSTFQFRLIKRNDGSGYQAGSQVDTDNEGLARKLREAAKNSALGLVEVAI